MKRVVVISDTHCGHRAGLTPPGWQYDTSCQDEDRRKFGEMQSAVWDWFAAEVAALGQIDVLLCNGDMVDGKGERSGGTEQLEQDMQKQASMAAEVIGAIGAREVVMTYGTPYHTGCDTDWEAIVELAAILELSPPQARRLVETAGFRLWKFYDPDVKRHRTYVRTEEAEVVIRKRFTNNA